MKNQGISLISLIITIIVVIILAAIAIFSGFGAVDSASLADFAQKYDNVQMAVLNTYGNVLAETAIAGKGYKSADIYANMVKDQGTNFSGDIFKGAGNEFKEIDPAKVQGMSELPEVGGHKTWKINGAGKVVFSNGFKYKNGNETKVYVTPDASEAITESVTEAQALAAALVKVK